MNEANKTRAEKTEKATISVILPVYNVRKFMDTAIDSVLAQTYEELEIILVDDGSTDGSSERCDHYAQQDARIRVIHQPNGGLSAARNAGLDAATGELIAFLDSDDAMMPTMLQELWQAMQQTHADIVQCEYMEVVEGSDHTESAEVAKDETERFDREMRAALEQGKNRLASGILAIYSNEQDKQEQIWKNYRYTPVQWNKLYKRKIFDVLRYPVGKYHEDEYVIHRELYRANALVHLKSKLHLYRRHEDTITAHPTAEKACHVSEAYLDRVKFQLEEHGEEGLTEAGLMSYRGMLQYVREKRKEAANFADADRWMPNVEAHLREAERIARSYEKTSLRGRTKDALQRMRSVFSKH